MNKKYYILAFLMTLFVLSCKKIEPPVDDSNANDPIYSLEGLMNGDSINLYVNDTTVFISDAPYNLNGVEGYSSTISDLETGFELKMIVIRPEIYIDEDGIKLIENENLDFLIHQPVCKSFDFPLGSTQSNFFNVDMGQGNSQGGDIMVDEYGVYDTKMKFSNISSQIYTIPVEVGFKDEILNPYFNLSGSGNLMIYEADNSNLEHEWKLDGDHFSSTNDGEIIMTNGIHKVSHSITDNYNNIATYTTLVYYAGGQMNWALENSYCSNDVDVNNYGRVFLEVMFKGEKYTSAYNMTNKSNNLQVSNVVYLVDAETQSINFIKFNIAFDAQLKTLDNTKIINMKNMKGTFHIAIN